MTEDNINNPDHYNRNGIEVIDVIETYTPESPHLANVLKYVCRHSYKGKPLEDLRKAAWYLDRAIAIVEGEEEERAWVEQQMNDPEHVALRDRIKEAVFSVFRAAPPVDVGRNETDSLFDHDDINGEVEFDNYGRVVRCSLPVNIDGEFFIPEDDEETDFSEPIEDYLLNLPYNGRVAGQGAPHIYDEFYNFDRNEVVDVCWNGCGEVIERGDIYLTHCGKAFCSTKCVDDFKFWQGGER